ncbi:hypothetical protein V6615_05120 [Oscillospiraceae bacterium PP1C4]
MTEKQVTQLEKSKRTLRNISIILNWIWCGLLLPIIPISFMAGVSTVMITDSGEVSQISLLLVTIATPLFFTTPVIIIICVIASYFFRKKYKFVMSVMIQLMPIVYSLANICLLLLIFRLV